MIGSAKHQQIPGGAVLSIATRCVAYDRALFTTAWIAFVTAGLFFALTTPLGEGIDEPAHFAYIQHIAQTGSPPLGHVRYLPEEISRFLRTQPVSWSLHTLYPSLQSHDDYWKQAPEEQALRDQQVRGLRFSGVYTESSDAADLQYESHQPPLYYLLSTPVFAASAHWLSFVDTFLLTRVWSVLLASLVIPAAYLLARVVFEDTAARHAVLALMVTFPGLYPGVVRVSNDGLAVVLATWFFFCLVAFLQTDRQKYFYGLCAFAVAGLWTKAFFIPILAAAALSMLWHGKTRKAGILLLVAVLGSVWYVETFFQTGSLTGLPETVAARTSIASSAAALWKLDWSNATTVLRASHIWVGNGSLLGVRAWMYRVIGWLYIALLIGAIFSCFRGATRPTAPLLLGYAAFAMALAYFATQVFQQTGTSVIQGWYLTFFLPVECVIAVAGARALLGKRWNWAASFLMIALFTLLIYSALFVAMPYYAGITSHNAAGHLETYHPSSADFPVMTHRLMRFEPIIPAALPWFCLCIVAAFCVYSLLSINGILRR